MKKSTLFAIVVVTLCLSACNFKDNEKLKSKIKEELYNEFKEEMHDELYNELRTELFAEIMCKLDSTQIVNDNIRKIHKALKKRHSDIPDDYRIFKDALVDTNILRMVYGKLEEDDCVLFLPNYESFKIDLGYGPEQGRSPGRLIVKVN